MPAYETKGAEVYTNGSAGHMNGTEPTRMREVAFEKNPSEPMVNHSDANSSLFMSRLLPFCLSLPFRFPVSPLSLWLTLSFWGQVDVCCFHVFFAFRGWLWNLMENRSALWPEYYMGEWYIDKVQNSTTSTNILKWLEWICIRTATLSPYLYGK